MSTWMRFNRVGHESSVTINMDQCVKLDSDVTCPDTTWLIFASGVSPEHVTTSRVALELDLHVLNMAPSDTDI